MSRFDWAHTTRTCYCGKVFYPKTHNQVNCCELHAYIKKVAGQSYFGRKLMLEHPKLVVKHYHWLK